MHDMNINNYSIATKYKIIALEDFSYEYKPIIHRHPRQPVRNPILDIPYRLLELSRSEKYCQEVAPIIVGNETAQLTGKQE